MAHMSEARLRANRKYADKNCVSFSIQLNRNTDADILDHLNKQENRQGYIKELIREDLNRG